MNLDGKVMKSVRTPGLNGDSFRLSRRFDLFSLEDLKNRNFESLAAVQPTKGWQTKFVDRSESDGTMPG